MSSRTANLFNQLTLKPVEMSAKLDIMSGITYIKVVSGKLEMTMCSLGNRLKVARVERGLSQQDLANLAGVTRQTISAIETGLYAPSALLAFILAKRLDKRVDEIFFLNGEPA